MKEKVIIYGKKGWPYTEKARSAYGDNAKYFGVESDSKRLEEMLKYSGGLRKVPVIVEGGKATIGYGGSWGVWKTSSLLVYLPCLLKSFTIDSFPSWLAGHMVDSRRCFHVI